MAVLTPSLTVVCSLEAVALASACRSATRDSTAVRRALASLLRASTRVLTTVVAWSRSALGSKSKSLTFFWTSFCTDTKRFCTSATVSRTYSTV